MSLVHSIFANETAANLTSSPVETIMKFRHSASLAGLIAGALLSCPSHGTAQTTVTVDPGLNWTGYMNWFNLPADGGAFLAGGAWATSALDASFSGAVLTLTPNTSIDQSTSPTDSYWWKSDTGVTLTDANKNMDASMYVGDDALAGQTVTFKGYVLQNTLVNPYTSVAFIKDFVPNYSSFTQTTVSLAAGLFDISLATTAGHHVQFGFETIGPDARQNDVASLGAVQVEAVPEPSALALAGLGATALTFFRRRRS